LLVAVVVVVVVVVVMVCLLAGISCDCLALLLQCFDYFDVLARLELLPLDWLLHCVFVLENEVAICHQPELCIVLFLERRFILSTG
jgi:hypothetical protein